jgi:cell division protein FtsI/penicillin-binding protein 2
VFKPLTLAAALEARVIRPDSRYDDRGEIIVGRQRVFNSDRKAHGMTNMVELLAYSRNVGAAYVASLLGETRFYEMMNKFGFGEITGVDLALEERGIMRVPGDAAWHKSDLATNSYGQGISVTPLQVAVAYGALANRGVLMRPRMVAQIRDGRRAVPKPPVRVRRVISADVASKLSEIMADSVELGMKEAQVPGYRVAGKSGTAGVPDDEGYRSENVVASFVGYAPLSDPRFVVLVKFDKPKEGTWGVEVAAPEFRTMIEFLLDYYGVLPTEAGA